MYSRKTRPPYCNASPRTPEIRFAIAGNPRTGSSHLVSLLDSHPDVACWDDEIFDVNEAFDRSEYDDPRTFLTERVFRLNVKVVGFKLLWGAMQRTEDIWGVLRDMRIRLIHAVRDNKLDAFISFKLAEANNAFTCWYGDYTIRSIEIDPHECLEWMERARWRDEAIRRDAQISRIPRLEIDYEELCRTQHRVLTFLEVDPRPLVSRLTKQRTGSQAESVTNYARLKAHFAGSSYARCFLCD
jgi:hypothetical protein